jgi:hypothetical protein
MHRHSRLENALKEHFNNIISLKYNLTINLNILLKLFITKKFLYFKKKVITKMMNPQQSNITTLNIMFFIN